jgi:hypothetical protein
LTKDEKKERRQLRRKLYTAVAANLPLATRLYSTNAQCRASVRTIADQIIAGKNPHEVQVLP